MPSVLVRADASVRLGLGHIMRCLALTDEVAGRGGDVHFVCRPQPGDRIGALRDRGTRVSVLGDIDPFVAARSTEDAAQEQDARETIAVLDGAIPDWLVVDHYRLNLGWEQAMRPHVKGIAVIDDLGDRMHECDIFVDQNVTRATEEATRARLPGNCTLALGPRFALLRPEYRQARSTRAQRGASVRRVLVTFGGSDPYDLSSLTLAALSAPEFAKLELDIVADSNQGSEAALRTAASKRPGTRIWPPQPHLADLMAQADLAIGAGGTTTWERMCVGVPSIVISVAENQRRGCQILGERGLIRFLGCAPELGVHDLRGAVLDCMGSQGILGKQSAMGRATVDGLGAPRLAEFMVETPQQELRLRHAELADLDLYFDWANDPEVRRHSLQPAAILPEEHQRWFKERLSATSVEMLVLVAGDLPVGQVRFEKENSSYRINYSIDALYRGRGWGRALLQLGLSHVRARGPATFRAEVKSDNGSSVAVFRWLGFRESSGGSRAKRLFILDSASPLREDQK